MRLSNNRNDNRNTATLQSRLANLRNRTRRPYVHSELPYRNNLLREGMWSGRRCFIVGGGPSVANFPLDKLKGELTIGINKAFFAFDPTIIFSMDMRFWQWIENADGRNGFTPEIRDKFRNYSHGLKVWLNVVNTILPPDIIGVPSCGDCWGSNLHDGIGHGKNSGFAALNLAYLLGANPIYLVGYDMHGENKVQKWFHDGYPIVTSDSVYATFIEYFENIAAPVLQRTSTQVFNLSPTSALKCFPFCDVAKIEFNDPVLYLSCYTKNSIYEQEIVRLNSSCAPFGLRRHFESYESRGSWVANVKYKAELLLRTLQNSSENARIVFLDADAVVMRYPSLFDHLDCDFACHVRAGTELLSGTIFARNTENTRRLVANWVKACNESPSAWDQKLLQKEIESDRHLRFENLPPDYCAIFDLMPEAQNPVIMHLQASRRQNAIEGGYYA
jgi:hypothetical protein